MAKEDELFELSLLGGATERRYEALRGELELPWESLDPARYPDDVRELARHAWTEVALAEFASAAVHSELIARLVKARAPLDLIGMATRFPLDELVHAELATRMAEALGGGSALAYRPKRLYPADRERGAAAGAGGAGVSRFCRWRRSPLRRIST